MIRHLLTAVALIAATGTGLAIGAAPSQAYPRCSSFSYGIGSCVNEGWNNGGFQQRSIPASNSGYLLEQPRFQPNFGRGYGSYGAQSSGNSYLYGWR